MSPDPPVILVVDDDAAILKAMSSVLGDAGYQVLAAFNGAQALEILAGPVLPQVILLDLMMPVMDGYDFLEAQRKDPRLAGIPVVVVTAGGWIDQARLAGRPVLRKPIRLGDLLSSLEKLG
jgi:CheY-like chemotaxis protein